MVGRQRAGVIGLRRGRAHVRVLQALPGVEVVAVADVDGATVEAVQRELGVPHGGGGLDDLLAHDLDFVVVATPAPLHAALSIRALEAGAHVLCEVQGMDSLQEAEALVAAVERTGKRYMLGENCCYWAVVDTARQLHVRGDLGRVFYAEAEYIHNVRELRYDAQGRPTWRMDRLPITYCTHSLGPLIWITGAYPVEVSCYGTAENMEPGVTDLQVAIFKLSNGGVARVTCSFANAHWTGHRYALFGTEGSLDTGWIGHDEPRFYSGDRAERPLVPNARGPVRIPVGTNIPGAPPAATLGGHGTAEWLMYQAFLGALETGHAPPIDVYEAVMYALPGICAAESARTGRPVAIPQFQRRRPA